MAFMEHPVIAHAQGKQHFRLGAITMAAKLPKRWNKIIKFNKL